MTAHWCDVQLWCSPNAEHPFFDDCRKRYRIVLKNQSGRDLGERMSEALRAMLREYRRVIIIGTDAPELDSELLDAAIEKLASVDIVLAPARDGGYVLLGASRYHDDLLGEVPWGTPRVLELTLRNVDRLGLKYSLLAECWDVDRPEDLERYLAMNPEEAEVFQRKGAETQRTQS